MTYGRVHRPLPVVFVVFVLAALLAAPSADARPAPASEQTVTLLSVSPGVLRVQGADGRAFSVKVTRVTWVLRRGQVAAPGELVPGETLRVRRGRGPRGESAKAEAALLVCDAETAEALEAHRGRPLAGTLTSADGPVWTLQPADSSTALPVCLSARTTFQAGGARVTRSVFGAGARVMITTRGLANGLLAAVSVSDTGEPGQAEAAARSVSRSVSGLVLEVRPDLGLLTLQDREGAVQTVAVDAKTRVKAAGASSSLGELAPGMRVRVWLRAGVDAAGNAVASSVSASAAKPSEKKKRRP